MRRKDAIETTPERATGLRIAMSTPALPCFDQLAGLGSRSGSERP